jgi:hypothetical protein
MKHRARKREAQGSRSCATAAYDSPGTAPKRGSYTVTLCVDAIDGFLSPTLGRRVE